VGGQLHDFDTEMFAYKTPYFPLFDLYQPKRLLNICSGYMQKIRAAKRRKLW
jgi:hypothetical protein